VQLIPEDKKAGVGDEDLDGTGFKENPGKGY
jgi:hypothetical protein